MNNLQERNLPDHTLHGLMKELRQRAIQLHVEGEQLRCRAPKGALTPALQTAIQQHKAELLAFLRQVSNGPTEPMIGPASRTGPLPLSFAQTRLWFLDQLGDGQAYNVPEVLALTGTLDRSALQQALTAIVQRHESLRTTLQPFTGHNEGEACQIIQPITGVGIDLPLLDLRHLAAAEQNAEIRRLAQAEATRPFALASDLMIRATLLHLGQTATADSIVQAQAGETVHLLLLTFHHIAIDGWSLGIFVREVTALYRAFSHGQPSPLPPLSIQYADFAVWQRAWLQGPSAAQQLAYWQKQLAAAPQLLQLPLDFPRPARQTFQGAAVDFRVPAALHQGLQQLSRQQDVTLFMTLLAAFQVLLARYTGQTDIVVGSPIANRHHQELEPLIGFFVNTLALRAALTDNPTFVELLAQVRQTTQTAYEHQDLPFERIVEALQPVRTLNYNPLVQVLFALQNAPMDKLALPGLHIAEIDLGQQPVRFDLELHLAENEGALVGKWIYNRALFTAQTIQRLVNHFQHLLAAIVADATQPIATLPLLTSAERRQLLVAWNETATTYAPVSTVQALVEAQVARTPHAPAVHFAGEGATTQTSLTYDELNVRANQLAHYLRAKGVIAGTLVSICAERSLELVVGILGILKAGGAYVPLDPSYPPERLRYMLADAATPLLLTQAKLVAQLPPHNAQVICLDSDWGQIAQASRQNPTPVGTPDQLAYLLYTSGSTGTPKGVMMPQRALVNLLQWQLAQTPTPAPRTLQFAPISFDVSFQEIFSTWAAGGTLLLVDEMQRRDLEGLVELIAQQQIERLFAPYIALQQLAELLAEKPLPLPLREVITAGEQLQITPALLRWFEQMPSCTLINHYGPTESHVVTAFALTGPPVTWPVLPPIGRPVPNSQIYILDRQGQPVPQGVAGELYIGGVQVALGYLNRPELTAERFIAVADLPIRQDLQGTAIAHQYLYKTGDLARWVVSAATDSPECATIEYLGRADQQVKIRGMRVELGEIETLLAQHEALAEVVVLARADFAEQAATVDQRDKRLVAYVTLRNGQPFDPQALHTYLSRQLPEHMVPTRFVQVAQMPLTPSGKINRLALPAPSADTLVTATAAYVAPATPLETQIAALWAKLLGVNQVGRHDNFFDLGGHSLLIVKTRNELQGLLERTIAIVDLFRYPTVSALAAHLAQAEGVTKTTTTVAQQRASQQRAALRERQQRRQEKV